MGCRRPEKETVGASNAAAVTSSVPTVLEVFWGENPPLANKKDQNAFSDSHPYPERGIWPNTKNKEGGGGPPRPLTISPAHSSPHLPNNKRSLVPGASSSSSLDNSRLCKIYIEYEICNMQYAICRGSVLSDGLGLNQCLLIGKNPPLIPDRLSNALPPSIEKLMHSERGALN